MRRTNVIAIAAGVSAAAVYLFFSEDSEEKPQRKFGHASAILVSGSSNRVAAKTGVAHGYTLTTPSDPSEEERIAIRTLRERRRNGEYILQLENPHLRRLTIENAIRSARERADANALEYDALFQRLGLDAKNSYELKIHQEKIIRASIETEAAIIQGQLAREDFEKRLKGLLTEEQYAEFRKFENGRHAAREIDELKEYAKTEKKLNIEPGIEEKIRGMIEETAAYTEKLPPHGPFDGLPDIRSGREEVIKSVEEKIDAITRGANQLLARSAEVGLDEDYQELLQTYYERKVRNNEGVIDRLKNAQEEHDH